MTDRSVRFPLGSQVTIDALADDPYPLFHELRAAEPVTWAPELGMWLLTRRDDVLRVLAGWERFTTDSPASTIRDIFGSHMLTTDGDEQIRYKRRFIGPPTASTPPAPTRATIFPSGRAGTSVSGRRSRGSRRSRRWPGYSVRCQVCGSTRRGRPGHTATSSARRRRFGCGGGERSTKCQS